MRERSRSRLQSVHKFQKGLQVVPTFLFAPTFFLKMPYYPSFFTLKCHLLVKIQNFFLARSSRSKFNKLTNDFFQGARCKTSIF